MLLQHPVLLQYTLLQHPLSNKANMFWRWLPTLQQQQSSSPVRHRHTYMELNVAATFGLKMNQGKNVMLPAKGVSSVYTRNGTEALRHLHKTSYYIIHPGRFARNALYERMKSCFWRITTQPHPKKVIVVAVVHHISWTTARAGPSKHKGGLMGTVDVAVVAAVVHNISWTAVLVGPSKHKGRLMGRAERPI